MLQYLQTRTRLGLCLGLRAASWAATAIRPLARVTYVVSSLTPEHVVKPDNFGSRSGYRSIGKH
jgi:hypothetical protein